MITAGDVGTFVNYFIIYVVGFILGSFGGLYSEASGIINIALEGAMVFGAFSGIIFLQLMKTAAATTFLVTTAGGLALLFILGALVAIIFSILFSFLLSFAAIKLKADQTIVGTALNSIAVAICTVVNTYVTGIDTVEVANTIFSSQLQIPTDNLFVKNAFSGLNASIIFGVVVIVVLWLVMNKMRFGLRLRACGENPAAADSVGINVNKMRYFGTAIGCVAAGLGGYIIFATLPLGTWMINALGYGFLVLAIEIFGNWKATNIIFCSLFFAFFFAFAPTFTAALSNGSYAINDTIFGSRAFYYMLPYLLALISLIIFSKKSHAPKAEGIPYDKSAR